MNAAIRALSSLSLLYFFFLIHAQFIHFAPQYIHRQRFAHIQTKNTDKSKAARAKLSRNMLYRQRKIF